MTTRDCVVIVPTLNERENLTELIEGIRLHAPGLDVLLVDDGSTDGTAEHGRALGAHVIERGRRMGIGSAYQDGFRWAVAERYAGVVTMDGDLSHEPRYLPSLLAHRAEADHVIGSRYLQGVSVVNWSLYRLALSVAGNAYVRTVTGLPVRDCTSGFQWIRTDILTRMGIDRLRTGGYSFLVELKYRTWCAGARLHEVPIIFVERRAGSSKNSLATAFQSLVAAWRLRLGGGRRPR